MGPLEQRFAETCWNADQRLGEPASIRWFLNWIDDTPREAMRQELLAEVKLALAQRAQEGTETPLARLLTESIRLVEQGNSA